MQRRKKMKNYQNIKKEFNCRSVVSENSSILNERLNLVTNNRETTKDMGKARRIVQGCRGDMESPFVHDAFIRRRKLVKLLKTAENRDVRSFSIDVAQAYPQSSEKVMRYMFIDPPKEFI